MITIGGVTIHGNFSGNIINGKVVSGSNYGGSGTQGSGPVVTEERPTETFDSIVLAGSIDLRVDANEKNRRVAVKAQESLQSHIETRVEDSTLYIGTKGNFSTSGHNPTVIVDMETLHSLTSQGSGSATLKDLETDSLAVRLQGSGKIKAEGSVEDLSVAIQGSGGYSGRDLSARRADVSVSGSGYANVLAVDTLQASVAGSGEILYVGSPQVSKRVTGSGSIDAL